MEEHTLLTNLRAIIDAYRAPIAAVADIVPPRNPPKPSEPQPVQKPTQEDAEKAAIRIKALVDQTEGRYAAALYTSLDHYRLGAYRVASAYLVEFVRSSIEDREHWHFSHEARTQLTEYLEQLRRLAGD